MTTGRAITEPPDWNETVAAFAGARMLVVGDVMLDEYIAGDAHRICPEAPVPVVTAADRWAVPGGAANAAAGAAALGARVVLGGAIGDDPAAAEVVRGVHLAGIDSAGLVTDPARPTTTKLRVLARGQQVLRIDTESRAPVTGPTAEQLAAWAERAVAGAAAVLLSDYDKGVIGPSIVARIIAAARRLGRPVVVDPKGRDPGRYRGATVVKPNLTELADLTGRSTRTSADLVAAGRQLAGLLPATSVLVTRGADGMLLFRGDEPPRALPARRQSEVADVTGAGDTAAATLALGLATGLSIEPAAQLANVAAGVAVCKVGTVVVLPGDLRVALRGAVPVFEPLA